MDEKVGTAEIINLTGLLQRPYWNRKLVNQLLGEPDETRTRGNGTVVEKRYALQRVLDAESAGIFQTKKQTDDAKQNRMVERAEEIKTGLEKAIELDLKGMGIPESGSLQETIEICLAQMVTYNDICKVADLEAFRHVYSPGSDQGMITPDLALLLRIAEERPELAFEAGRRYQMHCLNLGLFDID
jgi:hypothetical protein